MRGSVLGQLGGMVPIAIGIGGVLIVFLVIYILAHQSGSRIGRRDPFLGAKLVLTLLLTVCFQVIVYAIVAMITGAIMGANVKGTAAIGTGALVSMILPLIFYLGVRKKGYYPMGRKAMGLNTLVFGLMFTQSTFQLFIQLFGDAPGKLIASTAVAMVLYIIAFVVTAVMLLKSQPEPTMHPTGQRGGGASGGGGGQGGPMPPDWEQDSPTMVYR